ncbi:MAG: MBL fold metallo-hydrolase [Dehalococcoidia bacterium]|nr:MAG: MBL fold metallo-hydrolase [Dehalococcoidia bacterium]
MWLTVIGSSASQPAAGDACSGYLVTHGRASVLLDCGAGTLGRLQEHVALDDLSAIVISHLHPDHFSDLIPLRYGRRYGEAGAREIPVFLPPGGIVYLHGLAAALSKTRPFWDGALRLQEYAPGITIEVDEITVGPVEVVHGIRSFGMLVQADGRRLAYSSDTVMCDEVQLLAAGADVLLAENTLGGGAPAHHEPVTHLSAVQAGLVAARAGVETLVLTHFWHTADRAQACAEAREVFAGRILAACPGLSIEI